MNNDEIIEISIIMDIAYIEYMTQYKLQEICSMPAYMTHKAAGEKVLDKLGNEMVKNKKLFYLGCQGPDVLYSNWHSLKSSLRLGLKMHKLRTRELMRHALDYLRQYNRGDKDALISYFAGMLTHYTVDKWTHPYIYGKAGGNVGMHNAMEFVWDIFTSKEVWDVDLREANVYQEIMTDTLDQGISNWYVSAANDIYGKKINDKSIRRAQVNFAKSKNRMFTHPQRFRRFFIWATSGLKIKKMLFLEQHNDSIFSEEEFVQMQLLVQRGVNEACNLINFMLDYIREAVMDIPEKLFERNFSGNIVPSENEESLA